ncbi:hypothetical protein AAG906_000351 [Vitis piasezkii]
MATESNFVQPAIPKLDAHYDHWCMLMENFLRSKEYWNLIEQGIPIASGKTHQGQKNVIEDAKLKDLKYQGRTVQSAQRQALRKEFEMLNMKVGESVNEYFARTLTIANKMRVHGEKMEDVVVIEKILRSITPKFDYVVCSIKESNDLDTLSIDVLQSTLKVTYEDQSRGRGRGRGGFRGRGRGRETKAQYAEASGEILLMAHANGKEASKEELWFLDSGCSNHMCGKKELFSRLDESFRNIRMFVNGIVQLITEVSPTLVVKDMTREEVFGCISHVHIPNSKRTKLDDKCVKCVLLGYEMEESNGCRDRTKGYTQEHGVDYTEVFAPVARLDTIRVVISFAALKEWTIYQLDVKSTFLHGELSEEVFVYRLKKALYGLKQALRAWYNGIFINQKKYTQEVLERFSMDKCNPVHNPMVPGFKLTKNGDGVRVDSTFYKKIVGSLMYLTATRPDVMFVVSLISRFMDCPTELHLQSAKRILRYLKGTIDFGVFYKKGGNEELIAYTDSDYAGDLDDRKSTSGYVFMLSSGAVSWSSKKQPVVSLSTQAEYIAATSCACQAIWLRRILEGLNHAQHDSTTVYCDMTQQSNFLRI